MSGKKDCGNHGSYWYWSPCSSCCKLNKWKRIIVALLCFIILVLFIILVIWLALRPTKPKYYLQDVTVLHFNLSDPNLLSTIVMATIYSRNPNDVVGIYYDRLDVYLKYKGEQITAATALPPGYQGHKDSVVWSPYLYGTDVPIPPFLCAAVIQDETAGFVLFYVEIVGKLRWKVGTWTSDHYHIHVSCPAFFTFDSAKGLQFHTPTKCTVDV